MVVYSQALGTLKQIHRHCGRGLKLPPFFAPKGPSPQVDSLGANIAPGSLSYKDGTRHKAFNIFVLQLGEVVYMLNGPAFTHGAPQGPQGLLIGCGNSYFLDL